MNFRDTHHYIDSWGIYFSKITRETSSPAIELDLIINNTLAKNKKIAVLVSGGIDSELIVKLFARHTQITALVFRFMFQNKVLNQHDLDYICYIQQDNNVEIVIKDIDLELLWDSDWFWNYIKNYRCTSPQLPVHAYMCEEASRLGYYPVLTEMQPELKMFADGTFYFEEKEKDYSVVKYLRDNKVDCLESPLQCNAEILYSILDSKEMKQYIQNPQGHMDSSHFKREQYENWFNLEIIERPKFHGFEGSEHIDNYYRKLIHDKFGYDDIRMFILYNTLLLSLKTEDRLFMTNDSDVNVWFRRGFNPI